MAMTTVENDRKISREYKGAIKTENLTNIQMKITNSGIIDQIKRKHPIGRTRAQKPAEFPARVSCLFQHFIHRFLSQQSNCVSQKQTVHLQIMKAKHELKQRMMTLINPQNFIHSHYSANLLILDRNLLKPAERMKRQNLTNVFTLEDIKVGGFDNSKSNVFANSNITLTQGNIILLNVS